jgi:hypothetical protein
MQCHSSNHTPLGIALIRRQRIECSDPNIPVMPRRHWAATGFTGRLPGGWRRVTLVKPEGTLNR